MSFSTSHIVRELRPYYTHYTSFMGGLNNSTTDEMIEDNELSDGLNYMPDHLNAGLLIKRPGLAKQLSNSQASAISSIYMGVNGNFFTAGALIKQFTDNTDLAPGAFNGGSMPDWASLVTLDVLVNGTDAPQKISAGPTVATLGGSPPTFKYIESYNNMLWGAGHSDGILRWSNLGTAETWTATNTYTFTNGENNPIIGLQKFNGYLVIFCRRSWHLIRTFNHTPPPALTHSNFTEGCTSHQSIVITPYGLFWWSDVGLVGTKEGFTIDFMPTLRKTPKTLEQLNRNRYANVHGVWHKRLECIQMYVSSASATTNDACIYYFPRTDSVWYCRGTENPNTTVSTAMEASGYAITSGLYDVYLGSGVVNGFLYKQDLTAATDDGAPINAYIETKRDATQYGIKAAKRMLNVGFLFTTVGEASIDCSVMIDAATSATRSWTVETDALGGFILGTSLLGTGKLGSPFDAIEEYRGYERKFKKAKFRIADNNPVRTRIRGVIHEGYLETL